MLIKLWGVRGSLAAPLSTVEYRQKLHAVLRMAVEKGLNNSSDSSLDNFIKTLPPHLQYTFGGNTTCVSVTSGKSEMPIILDAGSGIRVLGDELMKGPCGKGQGEINIFFTHTHWDHIQGLPFFKPLYIPGNIINFYSPVEGLEERLTAQQDDRFFPVSLDSMASTKVFHQIKRDQAVELTKHNKIKVDCHPLIHPGGSHALRIKTSKNTFIFATDSEFTGEDLLPGNNENFLNFQKFFLNADLLIMDAQYDLNESFGKFDWGHTSNTMAVNCGVSWKVKNLILTHHEPANNDSRLYQNYLDAVEHRENLKATQPRIFLAREGMSFQLGSDVEIQD